MIAGFCKQSLEIWGRVIRMAGRYENPPFNIHGFQPLALFLPWDKASNNPFHGFFFFFLVGHRHLLMPERLLFHQGFWILATELDCGWWIRSSPFFIPLSFNSLIQVISDVMFSNDHSIPMAADFLRVTHGFPSCSSLREKTLSASHSLLPSMSKTTTIKRATRLISSCISDSVTWILLGHSSNQVTAGFSLCDNPIILGSQLVESKDLKPPIGGCHESMQDQEMVFLWETMIFLYPFSTGPPSGMFLVFPPYCDKLGNEHGILKVNGEWSSHQDSH